MKIYVLVSQGMEILRTSDKIIAEEYMNICNDEYYEYCQKCYDEYERPADNLITMFEEDND